MKTCLCQTLGMLLVAASLHSVGVAAPSWDHIHPADTSTTCSQPVNIWLEDFSLPDATTSDTGSTAWSSSSTYTHAVFAVSSNEFKATNLSVNGVGTWTSVPIGISGKGGLQISVDVRSAGGLENDTTAHSDYLKVYYKLDGGAEVLFAERRGKINNNSTVNTTLSTGVSGAGSTIQIIVRAKATATDEFYYFDNVRLTGSPTDVTPPASVTATPSNQLTCAQLSATLTGNSTTPTVTYTWTGPGGFSSSDRITSTTVAGSYTLTVTNTSNGCTAAKTITVQQNKTAPADVSIAPPDQLNCDVTSIDLIGSSSTPNVVYIWSGPDDFSDVAPVTSVTGPGDYTLTVANPANGCSSIATVTVDQDITECSIAAGRSIQANAATLTTGANTPAAAFSYKVYPNPVSTVANLDFVSPANAHAEVTIFNSMGMKEKILFNGTAEANRTYRLTINAASLAKGIHFCILRINGKTYSSKLLN